MMACSGQALVKEQMYSCRLLQAEEPDSKSACTAYVFPAFWRGAKALPELLLQDCCFETCAHSARDEKGPTRRVKQKGSGRVSYLHPPALSRRRCSAVRQDFAPKCANLGSLGFVGRHLRMEIVPKLLFFASRRPAITVRVVTYSNRNRAETISFRVTTPRDHCNGFGVTAPRIHHNDTLHPL